MDLSQEFTFSDEVILSSLRRIYKGDINLLHDIEEGLFLETKKHIDNAIDKGFSYVVDEDFRELLKYNSSSFSAFKVHRLQNDIAAQLLDDKGNLKSFERFSNDVQSITDHGCKRWLRTEYDTAIIRSHRAAEWKQFVLEAKVLPNIKWIQTISLTPREEHRIFWGLILPITHPFWNIHQPGDVWGCKCNWESTDEEPTSLPKGWLKLLKPSKGLEGNPGQTGLIFTDNHPYVTAGYLSSEKLKEVVAKFLHKQLEKSAKENITKLKSVIDRFNGYPITKQDSINGKILVLQGSFKNIVEHGGISNEILHYLSQMKLENLDRWKYIGWAPHNRKHNESEFATYYEFSYMGKTYYAIMRMHKGYKCEVLHAIKLKSPDDLIKGRP